MATSRAKIFRDGNFAILIASSPNARQQIRLDLTYYGYSYQKVSVTYKESRRQFSSPGFLIPLKAPSYKIDRAILCKVAYKGCQDRLLFIDNQKRTTLVFTDNKKADINIGVFARVPSKIAKEVINYSTRIQDPQTKKYYACLRGRNR